MRQHVACNAAEERLAQSTVGVGAHDQHVGTEFVCSGEERLAERPGADLQDVHLGLDAVVEEDLGEGRVFGALTHPGEHMHLFGAAQAAQGGDTAFAARVSSLQAMATRLPNAATLPGGTTSTGRSVLNRAAWNARRVGSSSPLLGRATTTKSDGGRSAQDRDQPVPRPRSTEP